MKKKEMLKHMKVLYMLLVGTILFGTLAYAGGYIEYLTKGFADTLYCQLTGCTMQGDINMNGNDIINATYVNMNSTNASQICLNGDCRDKWPLTNLSGLDILNISNYYIIASRFGENNFSSLYYGILSRFGNDNFTSLYFSQTDRYNNNNFSNQLAAMTNLTYNQNLDSNITALNYTYLNLSGGNANQNINIGNNNFTSNDSIRSRIFHVEDYSEFHTNRAPSINPTINHTWLYAVETQGHSRLVVKDDDGNEFVTTRDNVFIGRNTFGSTINRSQPVYITGSTGNVPNIAPARADNLSMLPAVGVAVDNISNNGFGNVMILGIISQIDTSSFATGDRLFVSTTDAGKFTNIRPSYPNYAQRMGSVLVSGVGNGAIYITTAPFIGGEESGTRDNNYTFSGNVTVTNLLTTNTFSLRSAPVECSSGYAMTFWNGTNSICVEFQTKLINSSNITCVGNQCFYNGTSGGSTSSGGNNTQIQFNNNGVFGGVTNFQFNNSVLDIFNAMKLYFSNDGATTNNYIYASDSVSLALHAAATILWGGTFTPEGDNSQDIGTKARRVHDLFLGGNLSDAVTNATVANIRTAYDHSQNNSHVYLNQTNYGSTNITGNFTTGRLNIIGLNSTVTRFCRSC